MDPRIQFNTLIELTDFFYDWFSDNEPVQDIAQLFYEAAERIATDELNRASEADQREFMLWLLYFDRFVGSDQARNARLQRFFT
jgi:hypothetical protein